MKRKGIGLLVGVALALSASIAHPMLMVAGNGVQTGSWTIDLFFSTAPDPMDTIEFFIQSDAGAGPFEAPGIQFTGAAGAAGWTGQLVNPGYVLAAGPDRTSWNSTWYFDGNMADSVAVDLFFYLDGALSTSAKFLFDGGGIIDVGSVTDPTGVNYDRSPISAVPEPATLALLGLGLAGLGFSRRKKA